MLCLLFGFLIIKIAIEMDDDDKALNTAMKSLEIAESPKINNYIFAIYFNKYIAEIYLKKGDLTASKMYFEKAVVCARENKLKYQLVDLYLSYGAYVREAMRVSKEYSSANIGMANDTYDKAIEIAQELQLKNLINKTMKIKNEFRTFCQLNSLI